MSPTTICARNVVPILFIRGTKHLSLQSTKSDDLSGINPDLVLFLLEVLLRELICNIVFIVAKRVLGNSLRMNEFGLDCLTALNIDMMS